MKKLFITLIVSVFFVTGMISQNIANYTFTTNQTTVLASMSSGTTPLIVAPAQNVVSGLTNLGFSFYFMGVPYTQFSVNSNGQMSLGNAVFSGSGISNAAPNTPLLVPVSGTNTLSSTGKVHYKLTGTAPNRILVVEWKDLYIPSLYDNGTPPSADTANIIQAQLHESTGIIEFKYGIVTNNNAPATLRATFISSSNTATTVQSVGSSMIASTVGFPVVTYPMNTTNTNLLNSRTYTFTPPAVLSAPTWPLVNAFRQVTTTGLNLYWVNHAPTQTAVNIYRSDDAGLTYIFVAALNPSASSYVATLPYPGISSLWEIAAVNEGSAAFSDGNSPLAIPVVSVVNCGGTSTLTASGYTGTLLWSTGDTTPSISVNAGGVYTVTQTINGLTSLPGSGKATPVPTITGPMDPVTLLPAIINTGSTPLQGYKTESGMSNYVWAVSTDGSIVNGLGTDSITVNWSGVTKQETVSVTYQNSGCSTSTPMTVYIINYFPFATNIDPTTIPQFVDPMPHFAAGLRVNAKAGGDIMVKTKLVQQIALSTGTVTSTGVIGDPKTPNAGKGNYAGYGISTDNGNTFGPFMWPAQTIETKTGNELRVTYVNGLNGVRYSDFNILADQTLLLNGYTLNGDPLKDPYNGDIPMVTHLHGGEMPSGSDGGPTAWFMPTGNPLTGPGFVASQSFISTYPNNQESGTLWYHPHDQGLTRINVYTGLAGYYFLRGDAEEKAKLPGWSGDDKVQEVTPAGKAPTFNGSASYLPEIELAVQDRMFNVKGELYWPVSPTNPDIHPFWTPEFFGDVMTVNGKSWPYLSVAPRKYRFRVLDGCNARFLNMWLINLATNSNGPKISVVGADGNFLDSPADLDPASGKTLFMAPGERYDVVIDFSGVPQGTVFTLMNDAPAPYPTGSPVSVGTTDRIMQFVVNGNLMTAAGVSGGQDKSLLPQNLRTDNPMVKMTDFAGNLSDGVKPATKREILLNEVTGPGGPVQVLFNNSHFDTATPLPGSPAEFGALTETPTEGTTEVISIINTTIDAHPIHIHLTQWQLVSRQAFDRTTYLADYGKAWATKHPLVPIWPAGLGYPGGAGSPYRYDSLNADGAQGGNPAIKPYLRGPVVPANPEEMGWKDDIKAFPGEVTTFVVRIAHTDAPIASKPSDLLLAFDPSIGPGYVWHCHIIDHEDMDMMRPLVIKASPLRFPKITTQPKTIEDCSGTSVLFTVAATTFAGTNITYQWQTLIGENWTNLTNVAPYSGALTGSLTVNPIVTGLNNNRYRVVLTNESGVTISEEAILKVLTGSPAAGVSVSANTYSVLAGQLVTFTPTPVNGGTSPTYEWLKNASPTVLATTPTYTYAPSNGDQIKVRMTSSATCAVGSPVTSDLTGAITVTNASTALGNGDWNTPATWPGNAIPTSTSNVVIPMGTTVTINTNPAAVCNNLIVEGTLTKTNPIGIDSLIVGGNLTVDGTFVTNNNVVVLNGATSGKGIISASLGTLNYGGTSAQTISNIDSTAVVNNLIIDNKVGVTLPGSLVVNSTLTINAGAKLTNLVGADLTVTNVLINSDGVGGQYGPGTFVDYGNTYTNTGGVSNVQQFLTGGRNWYVSSPVATAVPSTITSASLIQGYDEPTSSWIPESSSLGVLKGYAASIQSNGTVTFTGNALNTGVPTNSWMTNSGGVKSGYNLVGNPYPSYLNFDLVNASSTNLESTMWYRTKNSGNTAYVFDTYNATGQVGTSNNGIQVTSLIPPVQSYWVRVASGFNSGILGVDNTMRSHDASSNRLKAPAQVSQQVLRLKVSNSVNSDEAIVLFNSKASNAFDPFDSEKMTNNIASVPEIYTLAGTEPVVINGLNSYEINDEIPLGFTTGEGNVFTIKATEISNFDSNTKIILRDNTTKSENELVVGNNYIFSSDPTNTTTRFSILFKASSVVTNVSNPDASGTESLYVFRNSTNQITIHRNDPIGEGIVTVYSAVGQKIVSIPTSGAVTLVNNRLLPGVYMVTVEVQGKITTKKITL